MEYADKKNHARRVLISLGIVLLMAVVPYLVGIDHEFVYDETGQLVENTYLRNPANVRQVLSLRTLTQDHVVNGRRPLVLLSYFIDRAFWKGKAAGYRATNLLFHAAMVCALYVFVRMLSSRESQGDSRSHLFAIVTALIFAVHPVLVEAVHVAAFRPDVFCSLFLLLYLLAALGIVGASRRATPFWVFGTFVSLGWALMSKELAVIAPALLVGMWLCFPGARLERRSMAALIIGHVVLLLGYLVFCSEGGTFQAAGSSWNGVSLRPPANLYTLPWLWLRYVGLLICPYPLIADRFVVPVEMATSLRFVVGSLFLLACLVAMVLYRHRRPWLCFGVGLSLAAFVPVSNLVPLFNPMAERYMYFMAVGFALFAGRLLAHGGLRTGKLRFLRQGVLGAILPVFLVLCFVRVPDWRSDSVLWQKTLRDEPRSARAHTWVGLDLKSQDRLPEAIEMFARATQLNPQDVTPLINRAIIYGQLGDMDEAEQSLRQAVLLRPDKPSTHWNLSVALQLQNRFDEALEELERVLAIDPLHRNAWRAKVVMHVAREEYDQAMVAAHSMHLIDPTDREAMEAGVFLKQKLTGGGLP